MNMKDAFRFQNKLQTLMGTAQDILSSSRNITKVENTYLRKKVFSTLVMKSLSTSPPPNTANKSPAWLSSCSI